MGNTVTDVQPRPGAAPEVSGVPARANGYRDAAAAALILLALLLPWNIYTGTTISGTTGWVIALLVLLTPMPLAGLVLTHLGPKNIRGSGADTAALDRLRPVLALPYLALVAGFLGYAVVQAVRFGGTDLVAPGVGPGLWFGLAGALLAAQPVLTSATDAPRGSAACRVIGVLSIVFAVFAVAFNLYWRTRFVLPKIDDPESGTQYLVVAIVAVLYGLVALIPVIIGARWVMSATRTARMSTVLLGASALVAGAFVWLLPAGRWLDAFRGVALDSSVAGVGYEGYLAWIAAAAIGGSVTVLAGWRADAASDWLAAARRCLILIAAWCAGSAVLRIADIMLASVLDKPDPPYISTTLMVFDLVVALAAAGLYINSAGTRTAPRIRTLLYGVVFVLTVCRVILGVALIPRVVPLNPQAIPGQYGNTLIQQITGTFDVTLCVLALALLAVAFGSAVVRDRPAPQRRPAAPVPAAAHPKTPPQPAVPADPWATAAQPAATAPAPAVARPLAETGPPPAPKAQSESERIAAVLAQSSQRFAAGTTYGGPESSQD